MKYRVAAFAFLVAAAQVAFGADTNFAVRVPCDIKVLAESLSAASSGLLQMLSAEEIAGVMAHEMAHIKDYDIRFMALVAILAGTIVLISDWLLRSMWWRNRCGAGGLSSMTPTRACAWSLAQARRVRSTRCGLTRRR